MGNCLAVAAPARASMTASSPEVRHPSLHSRSFLFDASLSLAFLEGRGQTRRAARVDAEADADADAIDHAGILRTRADLFELQPQVDCRGRGRASSRERLVVARRSRRQGPGLLLSGAAATARTRRCLVNLDRARVHRQVRAGHEPRGACQRGRSLRRSLRRLQPGFGRGRARPHQESAVVYARVFQGTRHAPDRTAVFHVSVRDVP